VPPHTTITSVTPSGTPTNSTNISFAFTADQVGVTFTCTLDGVASSCASPKQYSSLANGAHSFTVAATNSSGQTDPTPAKYAWTVDTAPPVVTITNAAGLPTLTNSSSISVQFTSDDAVSYTCSIDGGTPATCTSPVKYTGLAQGAHVVAIYGTDALGNTDTTPASFQWTIDQTPPVTTLIQVTPPQTLSNVTTYSFQFGANKPSTFLCNVDQGGPAPCTSPVTLSNLTQGNHSFSVYATDLAGNVGQPASFLWTVDLTPPVITLGQVTPPPGLTNAANVAVNFTANKASNFTCSMDGAAPAACVSPFTQTVTTEGAHSATIVATDLAGNVSAPVQVSWTMDFTPPTLSWGTFVPSANTYINSASFSAQVISSEIDTLSCSLNGSLLGQNASPVTLTGLAEGPYTLSVTGTDLAGNVSKPISHYFIVDVTPPVVTISATHNGDVSNDTTNTITFSANETSSFQCNFDGAGFSTCQSPVQLSGVSAGQHTFQVNATDLAGNLSQAVQVSWTVDLTPPVTSITVTQLATNSFQFALSANKSVQGFTCSLDGAAFASCSATTTESGLSPGTHTFTAKATDLAGNVDPTGATVQVTVLQPISTQITSVTPPNSPTNSTTIAFAFTADQAGATFLCSLDGAARTSCGPASATYGGLLQATHTFQVWAVDRFNLVDPVGASYTWVVDLTPPVTTLTSTRTSNVTISFVFTANKAVSRFECSLDGAAFSTCASPVSLSGVTVGSHSFTARSIDLAGNVGAPASPVAWTVNPPLTTTITSETPALALTNITTESISFTSNLGTATFQCSLDGAAFTACTSPASYSGLSSTSHTFTVQAVDPWGAADPTGATYSWTVDTTPPTIPVGPALAATSTSITVTWTTSKPATSAINWGLGNNTNNVIPDDGILTTSHSKTITGLVPATKYSVIVSGHDQAGNTYVSTKMSKTTNP
jgi:hypothetical protein